jgi:outer membrane protein W
MAQATFTAQYHIPISGRWRPYLGMGLGLAHLHNSSLSDAARQLGARAVRSNLMTGFAAQLGVTYRYDRRWVLSVDVTYNGASGEVRIEDSDGETSHRLDTDFSPWIVGIGAAYRF